MGIVNRHPDAGVGVHHLLGGNDLDLVRIGLQSVEFCHAVYFRQIDIQQIKRPVGSIAQPCGVLVHGINRSHSRTLIVGGTLCLEYLISSIEHSVKKRAAAENFSLRYHVNPTSKNRMFTKFYAG
ncbi:hypothetical protein D3C81_1801170 [compost metagenome]